MSIVLAGTENIYRIDSQIRFQRFFRNRNSIRLEQIIGFAWMIIMIRVCWLADDPVYRTSTNERRQQQKL